MSSPFSAHPNARVSRPRSVPKAALALSFLVAIHGALAAPQPLTIGEAQQRAVARSRQLGAQDQAITAANEMAVAAGQRPDPVLKVGIDNLPVSGSDRLSLGSDFMTMRRIGVSQELTRADKLHWRSAHYQIEGDKALAQKDVALAAIQRNTAIAWLEVFYTEQMASAVSAHAAVSRQEIEAAEASYRGGRGSSADILAARSALLALDDRVSEVQRRQRAAHNMLARWTGEDTLVAGAPNIERIRLDPTSLDTDLAHHPEIAVLNKQEDIAQADVNLARANQHTDWSVEVAFQQRGSAYSNMVSVGISVPLQWDRKNRQDRELAAKLAVVEQTKAERDEMLREHVAETRSLIIAWQSGRERIARYTHESLPLASERSRAVLAAYRGGKVTLADVLATRRGEVELRLQALEVELDTARLWAQLNFLFPEGGAAQHSAANNHQEAK
ncbi:TolC family protein [Rugamonas rivuli]|uniref:Heavy metal resistance protein CzcC n=1 Tax=Rugamonas rivuli TaxID=2743358 RepID=A0A843SCM0_9BURK|nr:TolC family protein [Rugamonas rivuli]MQA18447.1 heavy metal resistance protein CzcC [Rugamonas rivuli]